MGFIMNWILKGLGGKLGPWILGSLLIAWPTSMAGSYWWGRADGAKIEQTEQLKDLVQGQAQMINIMANNMQTTEEYYLNQEISNREMSELIRYKIENKETYYKDLKSEPVIIEKDCRTTYDSSLGLLGRAAKGAGEYTTTHTSGVPSE